MFTASWLILHKSRKSALMEDLVFELDWNSNFFIMLITNQCNPIEIGCKNNWASSTHPELYNSDSIIVKWLVQFDAKSTWEILFLVKSTNLRLKNILKINSMDFCTRLFFPDLLGTSGRSNLQKPKNLWKSKARTRRVFQFQKCLGEC